MTAAGHEPFETLVERHGAAVLRVCVAVVGPVDADDVWSETFLAALRAYPSLRPGSNIEAWLVTIAHRKAIDLLRARSRAPLPVDELPEASGTAGSTQAGPSHDGADQGDAARELRDALQALPEKQRQALAYHHLAGLPYAEIAAILGNSEAAARRAAADGMRTLRRRYLSRDSLSGETQ